MRRIGTAALAALGLVSAAAAEPAMMGPQWAEAMCRAWNADATLTEALVESGWVENHKGRGYKVMQVYRADCADAARIELRVSARDGKAVCVYGGKAESKLDGDADYLMWADTARWLEMGKGEYGPMRAMLFRRLRFDGPMNEAMANMGPFGSFLLLVGKVPGDSAACPKP